MAQIPDFTYMTAEEAINQDEFIEPPASFKSAVWKYFKLTKSRKLSVCNVCNTVMSYSGNTTNLQTHLRRHHPHIDICLGQGTYSGGNSTNTLKSSPVPVSSIFNSTESSSSDSFLSLNVNKLIPVGGSGKSWLITDAITKYLASDLRPVSVIEDPCFRNLIHILDPSYNFPATQQFTEIEIPRLYHSVKSNIKEKVSCAERVAFSTDIWTSKSKQNHVTVTCHYIDSDWQVKGYVLQTCVLSECCSGNEIATSLWHIAEEWELQDTLSAVVTDSSTYVSMTSSSPQRQFELLLVCFAQNLNKATLDGFSVPDVMDLLQKVRKIVTFFYMNKNATGILKQKQTILDVPQNNLMTDVRDKSTSSHDMLEQFLEQKSAIYAALTSKEMRKETIDIVMLTDDEIANIKFLVDLFKPMKMAMQAICEKSAPTLSVVAPLLSQLRGRMKNKDNDSVIITSVKEAILSSLQTCHTKEDMDFFYIASALDPRFKTLPFLSDVERLTVFSSIAVKVTELNKKTRTKTDGSSSHHSSSTPFNTTIQIKQEPSDSGSGISMIMEMQDRAAEWDEPPVKRSALSSLFGDVFIEQQNRPKSVLTSAQEEVDRYKTENPTSLECNPLLWWKDHEGAYPLLAALAKSVLCIPGATVTSDVFTYSGDIFNIQRETLDCTSVDMMTFIKKNMEF